LKMGNKAYLIRRKFFLSKEIESFLTGKAWDLKEKQ